MKNKHFGIQLAAAVGMVFLLSTSVFAAPQQDNYQYRADRISTQGRITSITRDGDVYRVTLNHGAYTYYVPLSTVRGRELQVGDRVRIGGFVNGDVVNADAIGWSGDPYFTTDPMYRGVPFGSTGWMSGVVESTNRHMGYVTVRDDSTGVDYKIDVRNMDRSRPINVWGLRAGDHITINGGWENRTTFNATRIEY
jgi:hypothetical protein